MTTLAIIEIVLGLTLGLTVFTLLLMLGIILLNRESDDDYEDL